MILITTLATEMATRAPAKRATRRQESTESAIPPPTLALPSALPVESRPVSVPVEAIAADAISDTTDSSSIRNRLLNSRTGLPSATSVASKVQLKSERRQALLKRRRGDDESESDESDAAPNVPPPVVNLAAVSVPEPAASAAAAPATNASTAFAPQTQIVDGRIVMNRDSLVVTSATLGRRRDDLEVIEESGQKLTSASFTKWNRPQIWSADETELFYKALATCGTDFTLLAQYFPARTRKQIKNKFNKEERANRVRVEAALRNTLPVDLDEFQRSMTETQARERAERRRELIAKGKIDEDDPDPEELGPEVTQLLPAEEL